MVRRRSENAAERETQIKIVLQGLMDGTYMSIDHAVNSLGVSKTTLIRRSKGGKSRQEDREAFQLLTPQEEKCRFTGRSRCLNRRGFVATLLSAGALGIH